MSRLHPIIFFFIVLISCNQKKQNVYDKMNAEICSCCESSQANKISTLLDSCYRLSFVKNYAALRKSGIDSSDINGYLNAWDEVLKDRFRLSCGEMYERWRKELAEEQEKKLRFTGKFVSESLNPDKSFFTLILESTTTKERREFRLSVPISKDQRNDEITIEYEVVKNKETGRDELIATLVLMSGVRIANE